MGIEIERKFLVSGDSWRAGAAGVRCRQGYLCVGPPVAVRVRIMGGAAHINVKKSTLELMRSEFEYPIPVEDAEEILAHLCDGVVIEKTRYTIPFGGLIWEVDAFEGVNQGLVVAEVELERAAQSFDKPPWVGEEVSGDPRYLNSHLSRRPYTMW
ncbi:MAG TPA: CYTH domain-containing protein [Candidatus Hydrogenedentes bacterium]|nr:CYTH domain-containing protein [Candidatus Hydrogenedentota bacterium]